MTWERIGKLFEPKGEHHWMVSHAAYPCPVRLDNSLYRVFFASRDSRNRSSIGSLVVDLKNVTGLKALDSKAVLEPGETGFFDDSGVTPCCVVKTGSRQYLYYLGWNLTSPTPFRNFIGLAVSDDGVKFSKISNVPILDRSLEDPLSLSYPWVIIENGLFRMWYGTTRAWNYKGHEMLHVISYAESDDGVHWKRSGQTLLGPARDGEFAFSRPMVRKSGETYQMWFCFRGGTYKIGYAESSDGLQWSRMDEKLGLASGFDDWDKEMVEYPAVVDTDGSLVLFYNGNDYGKTGFGAARWIDHLQ